MVDKEFGGLEVELAQALRDELNQLLETAKFDIDILRGQVGDKGPRRMVEDLDGLLDPSSEAPRSVRAEPIVSEGGMSPPFAQPPVVSLDGEVPAAGPSGGAIRILLADDYAVVRDSLAHLLQMQPGLEVVGQASDGLMAVELARQLQPDVVVMDVTMPQLDGIEATRRVVAESPCVRVIGFSMHQEPDVVAAMYKAGAIAYLSKTTNPDCLIEAIRTCAARRADQV
jgi:CheY-like chemotaxis protein